MDLIDLVIYRGRNIYSHRPVIKMIVDTKELYDTPTKDIQGFNERLLQAFPNLATHTCGLGYEGGFLQRLNEGTYIAHVLEHAIIDIQNSLGFDVKYGKTRLNKEPSEYYLIYEFENEVCALECGKAALFIVNCIVNGEPIEIGEFLEYLRKIRSDWELGPSTDAIVKEAKARGIPVTRIGTESLVRLGYGRHSKLIESTLSEDTSCISADISSNKQLTKAILDEHKIPVPYGKVVYSEISAVMVANQIGMPVVVKPFDGNQGKGVHLNLNNESDIRTAYREASQYSNSMIVEKFVVGNDYRVLVVGDQVRAVSHRIPALVIGDGKHTVSELIEAINRDDNRGDQHEKSLTKIKLDNVGLSVLKKRGMDADSVPQMGEEIRLRENGNLSTGGTAEDYTDAIHPDNASIAVRAANAIGIDIAGIDIVAEDISKSIFTSSGAVIEVNAAPGIRMHLYPSKGQARDVAKDIVDYLFPDPGVMDFKIVSVTGTNGKTTTVRLIQHVLCATGKSVGMTTTSGTYMNDACIGTGDNSGPKSAKALLSNKGIDAAVLETARGGIVQQGLGYDLADVGVITNISDDHLGLDGIDTLDDLAYAKALVVEAVKPDGYAVLNAEDGMTPKILERVKCKPVLFYQKRDQIKMDVNGYPHVFVDQNVIKIKDGQKERDVLNVAEIPITLNGLSECNIDNALAATCALYALQVPMETIAEGLTTFQNNPGRFEIYHVNDFTVMLDYAHNAAGYQEVMKLCKQLEHKRLVGIIGMPGDRPDASIKEVGRICAGAIDQIYIKEDIDLRGRKELEVAHLLEDALLESSFPKERIQIHKNESDALQNAISHAQSGDLIVALYEDLAALRKVMEGYSKQKGHP